MIAVVPARGGSKGLPGKNIRPLAGKPLIVHTLECARAAEDIDRIVVTTDDNEIASVAAAVEGVEVPFQRPAHLATDTAAAIDVYLHTADWLRQNGEGTLDEFCVLLATSPLRLPQDIDGAVRLFRDRHAESVVSVQTAKPIAWHRGIESDGRLQTLDTATPRAAVANRQAHPESVVLNGSIYVLDLDFIDTQRTYFGAATFGFVMPADRSIDIDDEADFTLAESLLAARA